MTRDELKSAVTEILTLSQGDNQARVSELLTSISEGAEELFTTSETLTTRNEELMNNNEHLRSVNMDLFLKVGNQSTGSEPKNPEPPTGGEDIPTFESLFNDKGELI